MGRLGEGKGWNSTHGYRIQGRGARKREYEHRLIAARALGRPLQTHEEVHHLRGKDNGAGLVICTRSFHKYLHFMERVRALGVTRADLIHWHHQDGLPLEEIKRRLGLGEGMIGRWFKRMNIPIQRGACGKGSIRYKAKMEMAKDRPIWVV